MEHAHGRGMRQTTKFDGQSVVHWLNNNLLDIYFCKGKRQMSWNIISQHVATNSTRFFFRSTSFTYAHIPCYKLVIDFCDEYLDVSSNEEPSLNLILMESCRFYLKLLHHHHMLHSIGNNVICIR